jgi:drug/metabolite transporter (DMT)-like permease
MKRSYIGAILVLLSATGFGLMPVLAKFAYKGGVDTTTLLLIRFLAAAAIYFIYIFISRIKVNLNLKQLVMLFVLGGICYTGQSFLYFSAVKYIPGSLATLLLFFSTIIVAAMSFFIYKERFKIKTASAIGLSLTGLAIVCNDSFGRMNYIGILFALGAALVYSVYILVGNRIVKQIPAMVSSGFITLFAGLMFLIIGLSKNTIAFDFEPQAWFFIVGLVIISTVLPVSAFLAGLERLGSTNASVLGMTEPVFAAVFSAIFLSEMLSVFQMIGGIIVLTGATIVIRTQKSKNEIEL